MLRRAFGLLLASLLLPGCASLDKLDLGGMFGGATAPAPATTQPQVTPKSVTGSGGNRVAILAPLTGQRAEVGQALVQAARVALETAGAPPLDQLDTAGTPEGAASAARTAISGGAGIILGPLTSAETAAVAPIAEAAGVPVLAFTNDAAQSRPGIWPLGIAPAQQVHRLAVALQAQGKTRLAAILPENDFGRAMGTALAQSAATLGLPPPQVRTYAAQEEMSKLNTMVRELTDYARRRGPIEAESRAARAAGTAEARRRATEISRRDIPPAPFDAILLAETGETLEALVSLLAYYDADSAFVRIVGPSGWASPTSGSAKVIGGWYAAPDPSNRAAFEQAFTAKAGTPPPAIADIAFDAAAIARVTAASGFNQGMLTRADGFIGVNGLLGLLPDGRTRRGLAVFEIQRGGPQMVEPAPQSLGAPGS